MRVRGGEERRLSSGAQRRIGTLARELGLNPKTIRYYEEIGLLPTARRTPTGYRLYDDVARERLWFIAKAKAIGLTLREIAEILSLRDGGECPCGHVLGLLEQKLMIVDEQMRALRDVRQELVAIREEARTVAHATGRVCGIIELRGTADPR